MAFLGRLFAGVVVVALMALFGGIVYWLFAGFPGVFALLPATEKVALLTGAATIVGSTVAIMVGRSFDKRRELEAELRAKKIPVYDRFLKTVLGVFHQGSGDVDDFAAFLRGWQSEMLLWGSSGVVKAYICWMSTLKAEAARPTARSIRATESLVRAIRQELGHQDRTLPEHAFVSVILKNPGLFIEMCKKNPNVSLQELAAAEALLEAAAKERGDAQSKPQST